MPLITEADCLCATDVEQLHMESQSQNQIPVLAFSIFKGKLVESAK